MDSNQSTSNKVPSQEHINFINEINDAKIPRQNQLIANRLFMKNFPRETTSVEVENCFQAFGAVHDVKIIAKENTHFAFISFVNESTALDVLRQHAITPIIFQNQSIILAPAYKKISISSTTSPMSYYPASGSTITPPPTPSRAAINPISQQSTAPYHQQQPLSTTSPVYPSLFFPRPANIPFVPMGSPYIIPPGPTPTHHSQLPPSFYPTFYSQNRTHPSNGHLINGHTFVSPQYVYSMGPPSMLTHYPSMAATNDESATREY